jgi:2-desacetyl-2-hydroxyethyl bacteriochlorophyllide A dehydrogenase
MNPAAARALWITKPGECEIRSEKLDEIKEGDCLLESLYSAVSPGTERLVFTGRVPASLRASMKCPYMGGEFSFPVKYGYSLVGRVVAGPPALAGRIGHVLHPHQERCVVRAADVFAVPANIPPRRAALASNLETAVNALWDSGMGLGDRALVVGFGAIGSLVARLAAKLPGGELWVTDSDPAKIDLARGLGFSAGAPDDLRGPFDVVFHASASSSGLELALSLLGFEGTVVELSWYGTDVVSVPLGREFHPRRLKIIGSQVASLPAGRRDRWDLGRRKELVFRLLQDPGFDGHCGRVVPFAGLEEAYPKFLLAPNRDLGFLIRYGQGDDHV